MGLFLLRRLVQMVPLLLGITFLSFLIVDLAPGDFFSSLAANPSVPPEAEDSGAISSGSSGGCSIRRTV